jgi:hypothetical protein
MTITAYSVGGTWATWAMGFGADVCRILADDANEWTDLHNEIFGIEARFRWQGVSYPASFGPIAGPADAQSYDDSVKIGVDEHVRLINTIPGKFITAGYSQGAEVVRRVQLELINGRLAHRLADCLGIVTFGDPARQKTDSTGGGGSGWGISKLIIPANSIPVRTYALSGDMYCTTPDGASGDMMHAVYVALTELEIPLNADLFGAVFGNAGLFHIAIELLGNPLKYAPGMVDALIRLAQFAATGAHNNYGPYVADAVNFVNSLAA